MVVVKCETCNKDIEKYQSQIDSSKTKKFYCSKECRSIYRSEQVKKEKFTCYNCEETFYKTHREIKNANSKNHQIKYCSKKCMLEHKHVESRIVKCNECGNELTRRVADIYETNFCNVSCYKEFHSKNEMVELVCECCDKRFYHKRHYVERQLERSQPVRFCSNECKIAEKQKNMAKVNCPICKKDFLKNIEKINDGANCCSRKCREAYIEINHRHYVTCSQCNVIFAKNKYRFNRASKHFCSQNCYDNYRTASRDTYKKISHYLRSSKEYEKWRKDVFARDNYKCVDCGKEHDSHAHHIQELHKICNNCNMNIDDILKSEEFNDINNGITLCGECHNKRHPFLKRDSKGRFCRLKIRTTEILR